MLSHTIGSFSVVLVLLIMVTAVFQRTFKMHSVSYHHNQFLQSQGSCKLWNKRIRSQVLCVHCKITAKIKATMSASFVHLVNLHWTKHISQNWLTPESEKEDFPPCHKPQYFVQTNSTDAEKRKWSVWIVFQSISMFFNLSLLQVQKMICWPQHHSSFEYVLNLIFSKIAGFFRKRTALSHWIRSRFTLAIWSRSLAGKNCSEVRQKLNQKSTCKRALNPVFKCTILFYNERHPSNLTWPRQE